MNTMPPVASSPAITPASVLEVLPVEECLRLLAAEPVGRVVFTDAALPAALPVNYLLARDGVVFRTATGGALDRVRGTVLAFEADAYDVGLQTGWTVLVIGLAKEVTDPEVRREVERRGLRTWVAGHSGRMIKVRYDRVTGRRISSALTPD